MLRAPLDLTALLVVATDPRSTDAVRMYFQPGPKVGGEPRYSGSRFERFAGGGDRPAAANVVTADDLVAVTLLSVKVPGSVALQLLEGALGKQVGELLA